MKNLNLLLIALIVPILLVSCNETNEAKNEESKQDEGKTNQLIKRESGYIVNVEAKNGDDIKTIIVYVADNIVDSLKIKEKRVVEMSKEIVRKAPYGAKYELTYEYPSMAMLFISGGGIVGSIGGSAENAYGVRDNIKVYTEFDLKGNSKSDEL